MATKYGNTAGFESQVPLEDKDIITSDKEHQKKMDEAALEPVDAGAEKQNASERINLQHIMELREAFDIADTDKGGALEIDEFIEAFGEIIGKNMNGKQLNQLFMKIDADSNGSVEWHEFMNYMLLENETLSSMKQEHSEYVKSNKPDPAPHKTKLCHSDMITSTLVILPEDTNLSPEQFKRKMKFVTSSRDGTVKIWTAHSMHLEKTIKVTDGIWVTCTQYMTHTKRLVAASANRMISFYDVDSTNYNTPVSRIEGLVGIPLCMEYYKWPKNNEGKFETLIVGDDLGICHMWNFTSSDWHSCQFKLGSKNQNKCHEGEIIKQFEQNVEEEFKQQLDKKKVDRKKKKAGGNAEDEMFLNNAKKTAGKSKPIVFQKKEEGVKCIEKLLHRGWITKIKYYADLNYVISSSLDGFIHIHDIENLDFKEGKTFSLHQKGVNSFIYSSIHRFVASCGEERHIIMWDPFTRHALSYLNGHTTSVQDLALNEERYHLISLGTDKVVRIWDTRNYICIQTIFDKVCYRPEDRLTSLVFDKFTNNILLGSRKLNLWFFKTQEEIKTSHEFPVAFALNNGAFESVVSCDDGGFIAVWDIEDGKLMSKFGNAHGVKQKITSGCFDQTQRRLITAGSDGTCKMWNFSNGECLTELISTVTGKKIDTEVTSLVCVFDPEDEEFEDMSYVISVGWGRKIHIWADEKEAEVETTKILPQGDQSMGHNDDIMSSVYCLKNNLIYTGGHDGTLLAWNFETGYMKYLLHEYDDTCTSKDYIKESKSVDMLLIMDKVGVIPEGKEEKPKGKLLSMTSDQNLRFWCLVDAKKPTFKFHCKHPEEDSLSAVAVTKDNEIIVTGDTSGQLKCWDVSDVDFDDQTTENKFIEKYFIIAHRAVINSIQIVEEKNIKSDRFIITASNDCNINIHRLSNGVFIGQFGQAKGWNIHDMSPYENSKPRYVREWYLKLKARMKANKAKREAAEALAIANDDPSLSSPVKKKTEASPRGEDSEDYDDNEGREQSEYDDKLADEIDFSEDEDVEEDGGLTIKNASQYLAYKPPANKKGRQSNRVDESKYFEAIASKGPNVMKGRLLGQRKANLVTDFNKNWKEKANQFSTDY